jgi:EipB-like
MAMLIGVAIAAALSAPAHADGVSLATFRSVHDLVLDSSAPSESLLSVKARLVTEFTGSACKGYTDQTRFVMETTDKDGTRQTSDLRQLTVETVGRHFTFDERVYADNKLAEQSVGSADRADSGVISVTLAKPAQKELSLPAAVLFPTELLQKTLAAAVDGKRFLTFDLYSGDSEGETVYSTSTVIGPMLTSTAAGTDGPLAQTPFAALPHWAVTISYFDKKKAGDPNPLYATSYVVYQNGMVGHLRIIYADFALVGTLTSLDVLPAAPCP